MGYTPIGDSNFVKKINEKEDNYRNYGATAWTVAIFSFLSTYYDPVWKAIGVIVSVIAFVIGILFFIASFKGGNHDDRS